MIYSIIVGLIAGWLAGQVMKGGGYGVLMDIVLGLLGGIIGGWVFGSLGIWPGAGLVGSIVVSFIGAVILVGADQDVETSVRTVGTDSNYLPQGTLRTLRFNQENLKRTGSSVSPVSSVVESLESRSASLGYVRFETRLVPCRPRCRRARRLVCWHELS